MIGARAMARAYSEAMLWATSDNDGQPLDSMFDVWDLSDDIVQQIESDCERFLADWESQIGTNVKQAGHSLFLNRNGHGSGFWAEPEVWGEKGAQLLSEAAKAMGASEPYVGDDGELYLYP